jgi:hypothetical protein
MINKPLTIDPGIDKGAVIHHNDGTIASVSRMDFSVIEARVIADLVQATGVSKELLMADPHVSMSESYRAILDQHMMYRAAYRQRMQMIATGMVKGWVADALRRVYWKSTGPFTRVRSAKARKRKHRRTRKIYVSFKTLILSLDEPPTFPKTDVWSTIAGRMHSNAPHIEEVPRGST